MPSVTLTPADLEPFATVDPSKAQAMIDDAMAMARLAAPCLVNDNLTADQAAAARAIIRGAVLRWDDAGAAGLTQRQQTIGPASLGESFDNRQVRKGMFWPSEIQQLVDICRAVAGQSREGRAFEVDTMPAGAGSGYWSGPDVWVPLP